MNQSLLKSFARDARNKLRQLIGARLDYVLAADTSELRQQGKQVAELRAALKAEGRDPLIERVAYTWFNRLAALRFMDAHGYHPFGARVITPATAQETLPELLQQARTGALDADFKAQMADPKALDDLLTGRIPVEHPEARAYRLLLLATGHYYYRLMPFLFEQLGAAAELLLPDDLLTDHSIAADFRRGMTDEDCEEVEVIGWLYQFYISERKDQVMARKSAVPTEDIPAVTQLFTPHWIVRYLVENSLGRLWLSNRPNSRLREKMPYYIADADSTTVGGRGDMSTLSEGSTTNRVDQAELPGLLPVPLKTTANPESSGILRISRPEEIRLLDPACGSGHMLTYAFDLLYAIYEEDGYEAPEIPSLILRHNLYGLEICERAAELAAFALCMKARARDSRFFRRLARMENDTPRPKILELRNVRFAENELREYFVAVGGGQSAGGGGAFAIDDRFFELLHQFQEAKNFGSLIQPCMDEQSIVEFRQVLATKWSLLPADSSGQLFLRETHFKILRVLEQAEALTQRYHVVVANPPYLGLRQMNESLKGLVKQDMEDLRWDLFSCFVARGSILVLKGGHLGFMSPNVWMYLSSHEPIRSHLINQNTLNSLIELPLAGFTGATVQICAFSFTKRLPKQERCSFIDLRGFKGPDVMGPRTLEAIKDVNCRWIHKIATDKFSPIPGQPLAYLLGEEALRCFENGTSLGSKLTFKQGLATSDNARFLRYWHEVSQNNLDYSCETPEQLKASRKRWFPYNKGGAFRKWYGNNEYLVNWADDGQEMKDFTATLPQGTWVRLKSREFYCLPCITYSALSSGEFGCRISSPGFLFDTKGSCIYGTTSDLAFYAGLLNSAAVKLFLQVLCATLDYSMAGIKQVPVVGKISAVEDIVGNCQAIARADWDNFETSWDFRDQPLLRPGLKGATLEASWRNWESHCNAAIRRMQELETENNRLFINAYGLQDELKPEVPEDQITLARPDTRKDMAAFLSYAVGCMMGRYSLDQPGLILANAGESVPDLLRKTGRTLDQLTFVPDEDGIVPVLDGEWFEDDVVGRTRDFLRATFGEATLAENVAFIEDSLGKDLRKYFVKDFYKDHLQTYKKRPIYWMFSSPEGSFQALVYLHRYTRDMVSVLLNDYVREFIGKLEERYRQLTSITLNESARPGDRTKAAKELSKIDKMQKELKAWERDVLLPLAQQRIELDLDDGVKVNYLKFKGAVVNIPGLDKGEEE